MIFGGTGGIGAAVARLLVGQGQPVHLVARDAAKLSTLAAELGCGASVADVEDPAAVKAAIAVATEAGGGALQGLCYAVGTINLKPLGRLEDADFERDFRVNALGAARAVREALPALRKAEGTASVLLFSTVAATQGFSAHASVSMAKGAVEGLVLALGAELAPRIRVNAIAPSLTRTPLASSLTGNDSMAAAIAQMHPLPRLGDPEDIAPLAALLLSPSSGWITGQVIGVDGGRSTLRTKG
jgi:NAD(P)-dependent dehydrogenase (short-subunit alcohol dehydrogenase family)